MSDPSSPSDLSREALFELVWSEPLIKLAPRYGLSDQGLRKLCIRRQVLLPKAGHWAKVAAGRAPKRPPLAPFSDKKDERRRDAERFQRLTTAKSEEAKWHPPKPVEQGLGRVHPLIRPLRDLVEERLKEIRYSKRVHEWETSNPGKTHPDRSGKLWLHDTWRNIANGGQLVLSSHKKSVLRVSVDHCQRALRLLNSLIRHADDKGYNLELPERFEMLRLRKQDHHVDIRISERLTATRETQSPWGRPQVVQVLNPTGRLTVVIEKGWPDIVVSDEPGRLLEEEVEKIFAIVAQAFEDHLRTVAERARRQEEQRERVRVQQERDRADAEEGKRIAEIAASEARKREEEQARRADLLAEARSWKDAALLREYVGALGARVAAGGRPEPSFELWREWALQVAIDLDRSSQRVTGPMTS